MPDAQVFYTLDRSALGKTIRSNRAHRATGAQYAGSRPSTEARILHREQNCE